MIDTRLLKEQYRSAPDRRAGPGTSAGAQRTRQPVEVPVSRRAPGLQPGGVGQRLPLFRQVPDERRCLRLVAAVP